MSSAPSRKPSFLEDSPPVARRATMAESTAGSPKQASISGGHEFKHMPMSQKDLDRAIIERRLSMTPTDTGNGFVEVQYDGYIPSAVNTATGARTTLPMRVPSKVDETPYHPLKGIDVSGYISGKPGFTREDEFEGLCAKARSDDTLRSSRGSSFAFSAPGGLSPLAQMLKEEEAIRAALEESMRS